MRFPRLLTKGHLLLGLAWGALLFFPFWSSAAGNLPPDTCSLLTSSQLERILGQPFELCERSLAPASHRGELPGRECDFSAQKGSSRKVVLIVFVDSSAEEARKTYDALTMWLAPKSRPEGVGDAAFIDDNHAIHVLKGRVRYYINILPSDAKISMKEKMLTLLAALVAAQV